MKTNKINNKLKFIFEILLILTFGAACLNKVTQNDLFFDLKTGESILKYGLDFKEHFSFIPNLIYIYHHYLYDLIIYFIHKFFAYKGVFLFFFVFYFLISYLLLKQNQKNTKSSFVSIVITIYTMLISTNYIVNRVQTITYLLFLLELISLEKLYQTGKTKYSIFLIILSILIANLHMPIWIFTLVLFLPFLFEIIINYCLSKYPNLKKFEIFTTSKPKSSAKFFVTFLLTSLTGFLTPLKLYPYTFFTKALGNSDYSFINEMQVSTITKEPMLYILCLIVLIVYIFIYIYKNKVSLRATSLTIGLLLFAFIARRNVIYAYLIIPTLLTKMFFNCGYVPLSLNERKWLFKSRNSYVYLLFIFIFILIDIEYISNFKKFDYGTHLYYPSKSVKYIKENIDYKNEKIYNEFNYGSYLLYNDIPVFIDSRAEVYIDKFNGGYDIVGDYLKTGDPNTYKEVFDKYDFTYALVTDYSPLYVALMGRVDYTVIYTEKNNFLNLTLFQKNV